MEAKFTLDEAFDIFYTEILEAQLTEDINSLHLDLEENQNQLLESLDILSEALGAHPGTDEDISEDDDDDNRNHKKSKNKNSSSSNSGDSIENVFGRAMDMYDKMYDRVSKNRIEKDINSGYNSGIDDRFSSYQAISQMQKEEKISDMKFPENIIFFIKQLVTWIKNNILNFIDKFSNIVRSLLGLKATESNFSKDDLKLRLSRVKDVESKYLVDLDSAYKVDPKKNFEKVVNGGKDIKVYSTVRDLVDNDFRKAQMDYRTNNVKPFSVVDMDWKDVETLREGYNIPIELQEDVKPAPVIRLDTSKDLFALRQSLEHFFDLFDNSFGSNDEKLFSIDDLEIMLELFQTTMKTITHPTAIAVNGDLTFGSDAINADKLKDNLLRTKINTDNLKYAYVTTNKQINVLAQVIMNKNIMGASQMGASFAFLSAATYEEMIELLDIIDARLKEAKQMEAKLQKMKKSYEKLVAMLDNGRMRLASVKGITYTTNIQRRISELYDGARYMTQTVQLRLNTLALYISELNDTRAILKNLNAIPEASYKSHGNAFVKLKKLFAK